MSAERQPGRYGRGGGAGDGLRRGPANPFRNMSDAEIVEMLTAPGHHGVPIREVDDASIPIDMVEVGGVWMTPADAAAARGGA